MLDENLGFFIVFVKTIPIFWSAVNILPSILIYTIKLFLFKIYNNERLEY